MALAGVGFNPRPPGGGRRKAKGGFVRFIVFQSTPPRRRATRLVHAVRPTASGCFNPRPPGGGRHSPCKLLRRSRFNPRPPGGGRQPAVKPSASEVMFQSTPPRRRATAGRQSHAASEVMFQSTPPRRRATRRSKSSILPLASFNPRPPGGGRRLSANVARSVRSFNPRPPGGGRLTSGRPS